MNSNEIYDAIKTQFTAWAKNTGANNFILGISGGKDSTVVAMLLASIFGQNRTYGVMLPSGVQSDIQDSKDVIRILGINGSTINIGTAVNDLLAQIPGYTYDTKTNLPARIRMASIFALGQTVDARMINTCNLSEDTVGYATIFGDCAGTFAPIQELTVTEVINLGLWMVENVFDFAPEDKARIIGLIRKTPVDGLQPLTDEEKLGFTYASLDAFIRENKGSDEFKSKIRSIYKKNKFKLEIVNMPKVHFGLKNYVEEA